MEIEIEPKEVAEYTQRWFEFKDGAKLLIADADKPSFNRALELNNIQIDRELYGIKSITDESALESRLAFNRAVSHLILGWSGFEDKKTKQPIEYSQQNAELLCTSTKASLELVLFCLNKSKELRVEKNKTADEEVGKSLSTIDKETSNGHQKRQKKSTRSSE